MSTKSLCLQASPLSWFSSDFDIRNHGKPLTQLRLSTWRERGGFSLGGSEYSITRESAFGAFRLSRQGVALATATKAGFFSRRFLLRFSARECNLEPTGFFRHRYEVMEGGRRLGTLAPASAFSRRLVVELADVPEEVALFMAWLVLVIRRRQSRSNS